MFRALWAVSLAGFVQADPDTHYHDLPLGERAAAMGGAYTAIADEATGLHYNPAGPAYFDRDVLNLTMSAYRYRRLSAENVARVCDKTIDASQSRFFTFPGSFGVVKAFGQSMRQAFAFAIFVPDNVIARTSQAIGNIDCPDVPVQIDFASGGSSVDRTLWFELGWAIRPLRWLAVGMGPAIVLRTLHFDRTEVSSTSTGVPLGSTYVQLDGYLWSAAGQAGVLVTPGNHFRVGFAARTPLLEFAQSARLVAASVVGSKPFGPLEMDSDSIDVNYPLPWRLAAGIAWAGQRFTLSADAVYHLAVSRYSPIEVEGVITGDEQIEQNRRVAIANGALGAEYRPRAHLALMGGFFTNLSSYPNLRTGRSDPDDDRTAYPQIHYYGLTFGGTLLSNRSTLTLVTQTMLGFGKTAGLRAETAAELATSTPILVDVRDFVLTVMLGGTFDL